MLNPSGARRWRWTLIGLAALSAACEAPPTDPSPEFARVQPTMTTTGLLVSQWAPVILQDVDEGLGWPGEPENADGSADFITRFNFDGNWNAWDNWTNSWVYALPGYVYTTFVEETNFWFITYSLFHPRDWCLGKNQPVPSQAPGLCVEPETYHENDFEGALMIIRKDPLGEGRGSLYGIITLQHTSMNSYINRAEYLQGRVLPSASQSLDGWVTFWNHGGIGRPVLQVQPRGHGVFVAPDLWSLTPADTTDGNFPGNTGVMYWYRGRNGLRGAEVPSGSLDLDAAYDLVWLNQVGGLWARRYDVGVGNPFYNIAMMQPSGDTYGAEFGSQYPGPLNQRAKPPWAFDTSNDAAPRGWFLEHPVGLALEYFDVPELSTWEYVSNPYCGMVCYRW